MKLKKSRRKIVILGVVVCLLLALGGTTGISGASPAVLHIKSTPTGSGNCSDWDNACSLQDALDSANLGDEIWVATGAYTPTATTDPVDPRTATFQLVNGVALYGGFAGTETSLGQRDWESNITILSGDIGAVGDDSDNSYHVVTGSGTDATAVLDGFTVTGGNADEWGVHLDPRSQGGGMYNDGGSPTVTNVTFTDNSALLHGGGMSNWENSSPTLTNITFNSNSAGAGGGMDNTRNSSPTLTNVTFTGNFAEEGGGMSTTGSPTLTNVIFTGNSAFFFAGGGMAVWGGSPTLTNVTFSDNYANEYGGGMYNRDSSPTLTNVTFSGNSAEHYGGGMYNYGYNSGAMLTNVTFSGNSAEYGGGGMYIGASDLEPALTNSILWGNTAPDGAQIYNYSNTTISYSLVQGSGGSGPGWDTSLGTDGGGNIDADPQFVDAPNGDLHLQPTSPAIDAGDNSAVPPGITTDLDGNLRIVNGIVDMGAYEAQEVQQEVSIDIKPGSYPNSINLSSKGRVPVAVLTTEDFDASTVDPVTVDFTGAAPLRWAWEDVDGDGDLDILFHFNTQELNLDENSTEATLNGMTYDGLVISGVDTVNIVP
jgi:predicted outer membrane repeat protein